MAACNAKLSSRSRKHDEIAITPSRITTTHSAPGSAVSPTGLQAQPAHLDHGVVTTAGPARARPSWPSVAGSNAKSWRSISSMLLSRPLERLPVLVPRPFLLDYVTRVLDQRVPGLVPKRLRVAGQVMKRTVIAADSLATLLPASCVSPHTATAVRPAAIA